MIKKLIIAILFAAICSDVISATYYVAKTGNNSAAGGSTTPWLTIAKAAGTMVAGDTCIIRDGDYDEMVEETTSGTSGNLITYQAENKHGASLRAFRLRGNYIKLDGLAVKGYSGVNNLWGAAIRVEQTGDYCTITNCLITNYPYVIANDFSFDSTTSKILSPSSDFIGAGFKVGSKIYLGSSGVTYESTPMFYANHDRTAVVASLDATSLTVTFTDLNPMIADAGTNHWAYLFASNQAQYGNPAIMGIRASSNNPTNVTVTNNTITGWRGSCISFVGDYWLVENNRLTECSAGARGIIWNGSNNTIRLNFLKNFKQPLYYSQADMATIVHPEGTGWYDWITQMIATSGVTTIAQENNLIEQNWFENLESPIGRVDDEVAEAYNIVFDRNVFIGLSGPMAGGRDGMEWTNNTFYRCGYFNSSPLTIGGRAPAQTGYVVTGNLFVACGSRGTNQNDGWYGISDNATTPVVGPNFVCSEELTGYEGKVDFTEVGGVNGGDPIFYNVLDYDGPDDLPFTDDDGLKVLANSPAAAMGGGALGVRAVVTGQPVASFRVTSPTGWFEPTDETYNPTWDDVPPTQRTSMNRDWDTAVIVGSAPVSVTFSASNSISGVGGASTNTAITNYSWNFGDGGTATGITASHTFTSGGIKTVTLTVTNSSSNTHSTSRVYKVSGTETTPPGPSVPSKVQNARIIIN